MRRRVTRPAEGEAPKKSKQSDHRNHGKQKHPPRMKSPSTQLRDLDLQKTIAQLSLRGMSNNRIAERLGIDPVTVAQHLARALHDKHGDLDKVVAVEFAKTLAQIDAMIFSLHAKAHGGVFIDETTGERQEIKQDLEAARVHERYLRLRAMLLGKMQPTRVEVTGANAGPIVTATVDAMEAARAMREEFQADLVVGTVVAGDGGERLPH